MTAAALTLVAVKGSLALTVFVAGLQARTGDVRYLTRRPGLWARSVFSMSVVMPVLVLWAAVTLRLPIAVSVALFALSLAPVPPLFPGKAIRVGADGSYALSLFVLASVLSIVVAPLGVMLLGYLLGARFDVDSWAIARIVAYGVLLPLLGGAVVRRAAPAVADRAARPISRLSAVVLVAAFVPILVKSWPAMRALIGNGTLVVIAALAVAGLGVGHVLGGPVPEERPVLALATASRHPAIAILIASAIVPGRTLAPAAVLLAFLVTSIVAAPYSAWQKRRPHTPGWTMRGPLATRAKAPSPGK